MSLIVDGRDAVISGSVLIPAGVNGAIRIPGGTLNLRFLTTGEPGYLWDNWTLTITSPDNPLGIAVEVPLQANQGQSSLKLVITVHTIGQGESANRIVHYTGYLED